MAQKSETGQAMPAWIRYQLDLRGIKFEAVAKKARRSVPLVSQVINGQKQSEKVQEALASLLGYQSWQHLWADAFISAERSAV
jgi:hypothetical protein